jgi:membrane-associated phospholipid phosphatase
MHAALVIALLMTSSHAMAGTDEGKRPPEAFPSDVASAWFETLYDVVKKEKTLPPPASRIYGIASVALYEAVAGGSLTHRSLVGQLNDLRSLPIPRDGQIYHWPTVANTALAATIRGLYPTASQLSLDLINDKELRFGSQFQREVSKPAYERSTRLGVEVARAVLEWASTDGYLIYNNCRYTPTSVRGAWKPTPPTFSTAPAQPCWGQLRTMVLKSGADCAPSGNPRFSTDSSSAFYKAALEVRDVGTHLTQDQKTIADYWADGPGATGTPPGHWVAIVSQIARNSRLSLMAAAEAFARVGIAVHDAFIVCWHTKYVYDLQRPVTFIHFYIDPSWSPYMPTPAFPSYVSGHSSQSGAAATVLTDQLGVMAFTDTTHVDHGLIPAQHSRSFSSFQVAADEAALSRLYGGIHYSFDNKDGLTAGECIGGQFRNRVQFRR